MEPNIEVGSLQRVAIAQFSDSLSQTFCNCGIYIPVGATFNFEERCYARNQGYIGDNSTTAFSEEAFFILVPNNGQLAAHLVISPELAGLEWDEQPCDVWAQLENDSPIQNFDGQDRNR